LGSMSIADFPAFPIADLNSDDKEKQMEAFVEFMKLLVPESGSAVTPAWSDVFALLAPTLQLLKGPSSLHSHLIAALTELPDNDAALLPILENWKKAYALMFAVRLPSPSSLAAAAIRALFGCIKKLSPEEKQSLFDHSPFKSFGLDTLQDVMCAVLKLDANVTDDPAKYWSDEVLPVLSRPSFAVQAELHSILDQAILARQALLAKDANSISENSEVFSATDNTVSAFVRKHIRTNRDPHPLNGSDSLMEALRDALEIAKTPPFRNLPLHATFSTLLRNCTPTDHLMVVSLKSLPSSVTDMRTLLLFLSTLAQRP
jgi:hemoglobin-like flavoprotein